MKRLAALILFSLIASAAPAQTDPRVMGNRYAPVTSLPAFVDIFVAAYDSGNRDYIASMVLVDALVNPDAERISLEHLMPPFFNTRQKVVGFTTAAEDMIQILAEHPIAFSHLQEGTQPVAIFKYSVNSTKIDGEQTLVYRHAPIVSQNGALYFGDYRVVKKVSTPGNN